MSNMSGIAGYEGWDYSAPSAKDKECKCEKPSFKKDGVCVICHGQVAGTTIDVHNVSVTMASMFHFEKKQGEKDNG